MPRLFGPVVFGPVVAGPVLVGLTLVLALAIPGICAAQDTNFATGPQYLANYGSPLFLHPITTPTLSLSAPPATTPNAPPEEGSGEPHTPAFGELQSQAQIDRIYWGVSPISEKPNVTSEQESGQTPAASSSQNPAASSGESSEIELSSSQPSGPLPASIMDIGASAVTDAQSLREVGYGLPLAEAAAYWRTNKPRAVHVYTNADIARLHGG